MEYVDALKLKEEWGDKPCDHPVLVKEKYVGTFLVTWVCTTCGREFTIAEKMEMYQQRKKNRRIKEKAN